MEAIGPRKSWLTKSQCNIGAGSNFLIDGCGNRAQALAAWKGVVDSCEVLSIQGMPLRAKEKV